MSDSSSILGQKVRLPDGRTGEVLKFYGWDWQAIVLTTDGRKVPCHPIRLILTSTQGGMRA